jgi:hypothetical protein
VLSKSGRIIHSAKSEEKANLKISVEKVPKMVRGGLVERAIRAVCPRKTCGRVKITKA